ncbi:hypothetical protein OsI_02265 [Oryza sativa Indica Group]|uniref:Uncharacterized protein n=1 Tax=Oryza sativa subsp. indica TaxID=39946 RepID=B8A9Q2_ORYSI|nr:hypothetical protein OsI_02265 [Oryza sativa Indica Group]
MPASVPPDRRRLESSGNSLNENPSTVVDGHLRPACLIPGTASRGAKTTSAAVLKLAVLSPDFIAKFDLDLIYEVEHTLHKMRGRHRGGRLKMKLDVKKMDFDERTMWKMDFDDRVMLKIDFDVKENG